jgi:mono/diheme cytochrome c family protein
MQSPMKVWVASAALVALLVTPTAVGAQQSGVELWSQTCSSCHAMIPANRYTTDQWENIMAQMRIQARLSGEETEAILEFLRGGARRVAATEASPAQAVRARLASTEVVLPTAERTGKEVYERQCLACHGTEGKGDGPAAAAFPRLPDLSDAERMNSVTDEVLLELIRDGVGAMPGFGKLLQPEELVAVRDYVRSLSRQE